MSVSNTHAHLAPARRHFLGVSAAWPAKWLVSQPSHP